MNAVPGRLALAIEAAGFAVLAIAVRALPWRWQLDGDRTVLAGNDAYYHARRTLWSAEHFPSTLDLDPYVNFPHGGEPIWGPLLDLATAALLLVCGIADDVDVAERVMLWIPPLLGAACVLVVWAAARRSFGPTAARVAALTLVVLVAHFRYSRIGFFDHHAAVVLAGAVLLALALELARRLSEVPPRSAFWLCAALGAVGGAGFLLWPGMLFEWVLLEVALLTLLLSRPGGADGADGADKADNAGRARAVAGLVALHLLAAAVVAPWSWGREWVVWGDFSPLVLTRFQPWLLVTLAIFYALLGLLWRTGRVGRRVGVALAALMALGAGLALAGDLATGAEQAWRWLARDEAFQAGVRESKPLLVRGGRWNPGPAIAELSLLLPLLPILLGWGWLQRADPPGRAVGRLLVWWTGAFLALTLVQTRFYGSLAVGMALVSGWWLGTLSKRFARRGGLVALLLALLLLSPSLAYYQRYVSDQARWLRGEPVELGQLQQRKRILLRLADWIGRETPETPGWLDREARPGYAVLSSWADGHVLRYVARRPTSVDNFGDDVGEANYQLVAEYFGAQEPRGSEILDALGARYAIFEYRHGISPRSADSLLARLYFGDGSESDPLRGGDGAARAVERHRLVWETEPKPWVGRAPAFKVYEHVPGALLVGTAEPGARVEAHLDVETNRGRRFRFVTSALADAQGRFRLRTPYATGADSPVGTAPRFELRSGGRSIEVGVAESEVRSGATVAVPDLRAG